MFSKILLAVNAVAKEPLEDQIVKSFLIQALSKWLLKLRNRHFLVLDTIVLAIAPVLALAIRLDDSFSLAPYLGGLIQVTILFVPLKLTVLYGCGFYKRYWRYASIDELEQIVMLMAGIGILQTISFNVVYYLDDFWVNSLPRSLPLLDTIISFLFIGGIRFSIPVLNRIKQRHLKFYRRDRVLIVGAGSAGISLVREMQQSPWLGFYPVAFIDDNPEKLNLQIRRIPVVGDRNKIAEVVHSLHIRRVIIAMPAVPGRVIREIVDICLSVGVPTSTLPGLNEILTNRIRVGSVRDIQIEDLLRRESIQTDVRKVREFLQGKKVLISGAGGSIGSELCRQVLKCRPAEIMLLGHGENSLFAIQQELGRILQVLQQEGDPCDPIPQIKTFIGDIRFFDRLEYLFQQFGPQVIFHAAAHKHVPLMESHPPEAIANNVRGTKNLLDLALKYGVENFVTISTDKAVNPTSIMGASKRVAEMLVLQAAQKSGKPFVVVRFGNVLGSRGSVVPTFKQQIAQGGPITITHPDICRYFMTIPEAVQLLLQAAVIGRGGEVFMLDMGQPVKIIDLAKDMIRLSGYEVDKDIEIVFTGLRPGEKLFEELFIPGEEYERTQHEKIIKVKNASRIVPEQVEFKVEALCKAATKNDPNLIVFLLEQLVPEYMPDYLNLEGQTSTVDSNTNPLNTTQNPRSNQLSVPAITN
ncbi:polysaccharide biosynthesis protein [Microseira wollei]|uniref:Polysaccharide biosynthesis protein CapD n=1 Tax=Microseira wollei NIES-4236 TaxID=2530354 RepID=A0AAV3XLT8_9CYAN|nr:nucleoside-diphosphate sugar epimerase/dehydratase [Microseira wollei]GET41756.1 polysaccharide biosynthesis protein CapD [Microseira wollei NIES-4236]